MNEKSTVLRDLISKVVANRKDEVKEEVKPKEVKKPKVDPQKVPKGTATPKGEDNEEIKVAPHPLLGNDKKKDEKDKPKPKFDKILPDLQDKSLKSGNTIKNITNKLNKRKIARKGK